MLDKATVLTTIFTIVDDTMKGSAVIQHALDRAGPAPSLSDSELVTIALYQELIGEPREGYSHGTWWINRPALCKDTSGWMFVSKQSGGATSSRGEAPSEYSAGTFTTLPQRGHCTQLCPRSSQAGTGGKGQESTSRAVHRRLVLPAAMAGVRCW
jgi:hypothetical protein